MQTALEIAYRNQTLNKRYLDNYARLKAWHDKMVDALFMRIYADLYDKAFSAKVAESIGQP